MPPTATTSGRGRQGTKRKSDDAPYAVSGLKRGIHLVNGEAESDLGIGMANTGPRVKRRKIDYISTNGHNGQASAGVRRLPAPNDEGTIITLELSKLPTDSLYKYLYAFQLTPSIIPSPLATVPPPTPANLLRSPRSRTGYHHHSQTNSLGLAHRNGNSIQNPASHRRRSEDADDSATTSAYQDTTAMCDIDESRATFAAIAQEHWSASGQPNERIVIDDFMTALRTRDLAIRLST